MFDGFYTMPPVYENIYRAVYDLKGRFDNLRAFPIGESARERGIFALALGDLREATLLVGGTHLSHWGECPRKGNFCPGSGGFAGGDSPGGGNPWVGMADHPAAFSVL